MGRGPGRLHCPAGLTAIVDAGQAGRAVANLLDNAGRHGAGPGNKFDVGFRIVKDLP